VKLLESAERIDAAAYAAVARLDAPKLDSAMQRLSRAADYSKLWIGTAALLAAFGGPHGRRAATRGMASLGVAAFIANAVAKPLSSRRRPEVLADPKTAGRRVRMPRSTAFPSGHTASAFAFATGTASVEPALTVPLGAAAAAVGYSRVHTGVHYPGDVLAGAILGIALAKLTNRWLDSRAG
jgi:undecaprenyl-diphosphatase